MRKTPAHLPLIAAILIGSLAPQAHAVSKEIIQLQTQVQELQDSLQHLQQSNDERMGVLQHLVEQTADNVNKMSVEMTSLDRVIKAENDATSTKVDGVSGQVQGLNDSVDELKNRVAALNKTLQELQAQLQNINTQPAQPGTMAGPAQGPQAASAPPVKDLYQGGIRDYNSASYQVAASEFSDVLKYYPQDDLSGNAQFYLAEIAYRQGQYPDAIKGYDVVLEQYPGNPKAPAAQLRKGEALMATGQKDAGIRELRSLIQRYPQTPEAQQARSRLNAIGVRITPGKPSAYQR
ncbi:MAG TPA: tetratricopeptide repeat protein [Acidisarcina sp.]